MNNFISLTLLVTFIASSNAQSAPTVSEVENYRDWKWDRVLVASNDYISVAVVPDAAGRILEYNLGEVPSLWLNPDLFGKSFEPNDEVKQNEWRNFGGYRLVPLPFETCAIGKDGKRTKRWPPPVVIGDSPYSAEIATHANGIQTIEVASGIQDLPVPLFDGKSKSFIHPEKIEEQLQYKRSLYIEPGTSLVVIKHTLINMGSETIKRGIMTSSQHVSQSAPGLNDGENFRAFVPFDSAYKLPDGRQYEITTTPEARWNYVHRNRRPLDRNNPEHVKKYLNHGANWLGETAPGVFEVHYDYDLMSGFHIVAAKPWICYVDTINNAAFVKILEPYNPELEYDHGINVSIFCSGLSSGYLETEVKTPLYTLLPGMHADYQVIHGAARIASTPILDVNRAGIITQQMKFDLQSKSIQGQYGVFIEGTAVLRIQNKSGTLLQETALGAVNPLKPFLLDAPLKKHEPATEAKLLIKDTHGKIHPLDHCTLQ